MDGVMLLKFPKDNERSNPNSSSVCLFVLKGVIGDVIKNAVRLNVYCYGNKVRYEDCENQEEKNNGNGSL